MKDFKSFKNQELRSAVPEAEDHSRPRRLRGPATTAERGGRMCDLWKGFGDRSNLAPRPGASLTELWRFQRDMVIFLAHSHGISQRILANVFDLPQSRISAIVRGIDIKLHMDQAAPARLSTRGARAGCRAHAWPTRKRGRVRPRLRGLTRNPFSSRRPKRRRCNGCGITRVCGSPTRPCAATITRRPFTFGNY